MACLFGLAMLVGGHGNGYAASGIGIEEFRKQRPENFYRSVLSTNVAVCSAVLNSLNEPYTRGKSAREDARVLMYVPQLIDRWQEKRVNWTDATGKEIVENKEQLIVDINNDGLPDAIYRWPLAIGVAISDSLAVSITAGEEELSDAPLSEGTFRRILQLDGQEGPSGRVEFTNETVNAKTSGAVVAFHGFYWWDAIAIDGRSYLVASDTRYWEPTATTSVLAYEAARKLDLICQFQGVVPITE